MLRVERWRTCVGTQPLVKENLGKSIGKDWCKNNLNIFLMEALDSSSISDQICTTYFYMPPKALSIL